jgi:hypothetical protein
MRSEYIFLEQIYAYLEMHISFLNIEHIISPGFYDEKSVIVAEGELLSNGIFQVWNLCTRIF